MQIPSPSHLNICTFLTVWFCMFWSPVHVRMHGVLTRLYFFVLYYVYAKKTSIQSWFFWQRWKKKNIHWHTHADIQPITAASYRVCLILATVELMAVIKDVFIGGVETGFDTVLHYLTGSGWWLELLDLNAGTKIRHAVTGSFIWAHIWNDEFITAAEYS